MPSFEPALLIDRALIAVTGGDAVAFLDNLVTTDVETVPVGEARFTALLSPQGKIQFEFFVLRTEAGFLLDTRAERAADLIKRLMVYRLRSKVAVAEIGRGVVVSPTRLSGPEGSAATRGGGYADPRDARLGFRAPGDALKVADTASYHAHRIALGIPEGGRDYPLGDTFPHEANYDQISGVSFTKGCFVGQEVVARMQNKTVVRKRVIKISAASPLTEGAPVQIGDAEIGRIGSVNGTHGLALLRLDRATEAAAKIQALTSGDVTIVPDVDAMARYAKSVADRPVIDL